MSEKITNANDLLCQINNMRSAYEIKNKSKKGLFPSKQYKFDCATDILKTIDLDILLDNSIKRLPNSYHIFFDYPLFKTFTTPEIYDTIIQFVISKIIDCINEYGIYEMHINLQSFSVSGFHRYKILIERYMAKVDIEYPYFSKQIKAMHVYNVPSSIEMISQLIESLVPKEVLQKVELYDKQSSEKSIETIREIIQMDHSINAKIST